MRTLALRNLPTRLVVGSYVLHTGLEKWSGSAETAGAVHGMATPAFPLLKRLTPEQFLRCLAAGEIATGSLLLLPVVPNLVAGAALSAFSGALLGLYARTPGMRKPASIWPSQQGIAVSKDAWMLAIGVGLLVDA